MPPVCSAMASARWPCLILALLSGVAVSGFPRRLCRLLGVNLPPLHHLAGRGARPGGPVCRVRRRRRLGSELQGTELVCGELGSRPAP